MGDFEAVKIRKNDGLDKSCKFAAVKSEIHYDAWKQAGWEKPELINKAELDEVELVMPLPNVTNDVVKDVVKELTERQRVIITVFTNNIVIQDVFRIFASINITFIAHWLYTHGIF